MKRIIFNTLLILLLPALVWAGPAIVFKTPDGVSVTHPAPKYMNKKLGEGMTEQEVLDEIAQDVIKQNPDFDPAYSVKDQVDMPPNRRFRNAWALSNGKLVINSVKAEKVLAKEIEQEATKRIDAVIGTDRDQKRMLSRISRLNTEVAIKKRSLTVDERAEIDRMITVDEYIQAVRDKAADAVTGLSGLTEQEKIDYDSAKILWPVAP